MATNYHAWNSAANAGQGSVNVLASLLAAKRAHDENKQSFSSKQIYGDDAPEIPMSRAEALQGLSMKTKLAAANATPYTLGGLQIVPMDDPRAGIPVGGKQAPTLVTQAQVNAKPSSEASKEKAQGSQILSGVKALGPLAQKVAAKYVQSKNPLKGIQADVGSGLSQAFPATAAQIDPDKAAYMTQAQTTLDAIGRARSGAAIGQNEWKSFRQFIPQEQDYAQGPQAVKAKLSNLVNEYKNKSLAYADSIANPVAKKKYMDGIEANMAQTQQDLEKAFLEGFQFDQGSEEQPPAEAPGLVPPEPKGGQMPPKPHTGMEGQPLVHKTKSGIVFKEVK